MRPLRWLNLCPGSGPYFSEVFYNVVTNGNPDQYMERLFFDVVVYDDNNVKLYSKDIEEGNKTPLCPYVCTA